MDVVIYATDAHSQKLHIEVYIDFYSKALRIKSTLRMHDCKHYVLSHLERRGVGRPGMSATGSSMQLRPRRTNYPDVTVRPVTF